MTLRPWDLVFVAGFVVYVVTRGVYEKRAKGQEKTVRRGGAGDRVLLALMAVGALLLPVLHVATPWLAFAEVRLPEPVPWGGAVVMLAALWLFSLAQGMLLENWLAGWSACAAFSVMYVVRVPREERMMEEAFGDAWRDWARRTGRLVPRFRRVDAA